MDNHAEYMNTLKMGSGWSKMNIQDISTAFRTLQAMQSVDDEEVRAVLNDDKVLALANQFHRVEECGKIEKDIPQNNQSDPFGVENIEDVCTKRVEAWLNAPAESEGEDE